MKTPRAGPIRIAFCITELEPGGAERCLVELVTRLDRGQFAPVVYCLAPRPVGKAALLAQRLDQAGISVVYLGARSFWQAPWALWRLRRLLVESRAEILQTFLFHANVLGAMAARLAGVPIVVTGIRVAERRAAWHLRAARWTDRWVTRHVCVSQSVREFSRTTARLPADKLVVIPNAVDVERFASARPCAAQSLEVAAGRRFIVYVGRLDAQKNVEALFGIYSPQRFSNHDLVLVGEGPQRSLLERAARAAGLGDRVHFVGFREDVPEILAASDLLVLPSRWEGMPNVVLEAMAAGKPVVATDVEGVAEALGPLAAEQMVSAGRSESSENHEWFATFAEKMGLILADSQLAARLGRENQARAKTHFTHAAMVRAYEQLYLDLLAAKA